MHCRPARRQGHLSRRREAHWLLHPRHWGLCQPAEAAGFARRVRDAASESEAANLVASRLQRAAAGPRLYATVRRPRCAGKSWQHVLVPA